MSRRPAVLAVGLILALGAGAVGATALQDQPQDARPADDPIGDLLWGAPQAPAPAPAAAPVAVEPPPAATPPPAQAVAAVQPPAPVEVAPSPDENATEAEAKSDAPAKPAEPAEPVRRQRRSIAVIQAIDKITTETMRFEVEVGGRPVRFNRHLIFTARACEVSASDDPTEESVAYLEVALQPRAQGSEARQIFRGWMFASTPGVSGLQHPVYDAWVLGCKAA